MRENMRVVYYGYINDQNLLTIVNGIILIYIPHMSMYWLYDKIHNPIQQLSLKMP
jgi:hypothetical protein